MGRIHDILNSCEAKLGAFSSYRTTSGRGQDIPYEKKPAQQVIAGLGGKNIPDAKLSKLANQSTISSKNNKDLIIIPFDDKESTPLVLTGQRIDRLVASAKVYVNTDLFPKDLYFEVMHSKTEIIKEQDLDKCRKTNTHWQNMAVGICHVQEIDLLVEQKIEEGFAVSGSRTGVIDKREPAVLLLSSPALNFEYGTAKYLNSENQSRYIKGMYRNLFQATLSENRKYIAMPAAGLGVFGGKPELYFKALMEVALEYPELQIIYHPAKYKKEFSLALDKYSGSNVALATKDIVFIADELTKNGYHCALHNPSDADVVYGIYDVGEYWKCGKGPCYVGEEHIGSMSTAPINSFGLNPGAYKTIIENGFESKCLKSKTESTFNQTFFVKETPKPEKKGVFSLFRINK